MAKTTIVVLYPLHSGKERHMIIRIMIKGNTDIQLLKVAYILDRIDLQKTAVDNVNCNGKTCGEVICSKRGIEL